MKMIAASLILILSVHNARATSGDLVRLLCREPGPSVTSLEVINLKQIAHPNRVAGTLETRASVRSGFLTARSVCGVGHGILRCAGFFQNDADEPVDIEIDLIQLKASVTRPGNQTELICKIGK